MFSAAGWIAESKHLPKAFRLEPFLLASLPSLLLQVLLLLMQPLPAKFSVNFQAILRLCCGLPSPAGDVMTKKHKLRFDELENLIPACKELLSTLCRVSVRNVDLDYTARVQIIIFEVNKVCVCSCIYAVHPCIYTGHMLVTGNISCKHVSMS